MTLPSRWSRAFSYLFGGETKRVTGARGHEYAGSTPFPYMGIAHEYVNWHQRDTYTTLIYTDTSSKRPKYIGILRNIAFLRL